MARDRLMRGLGWASLGLGIPPLLAPGGFGEAIGVDDAPPHRTAVMLVGLRELAAAAGLLASRARRGYGPGSAATSWIWGCWAGR